MEASSETLLQSSKAQNALAKHISFMMASEEEPKITYKHSPMSDVPHVGIIGAGLAGLRCADILIQNGIRVTILEARNRIGGRVYQDKIGGHLVDFGPNWMHGTQNNPIIDISKLSKAITHEWGSRQTIFSTAGTPHDDKTIDKITNCLWNIIDEAFEHSRINKYNIPANESLLDFILKKLETANLDQHEKDACLEMSRLWGAYVGDSIQSQSLRFLFLEECLEGTNVFLASTYRSILDHVAAPVVDKDCVKLNEAVVGIEAQNRDSGTKDQSVTVKTSSGTEYVFDEVVVTCPLGWLKQNKSTFSPPLPLTLSKAIDNISYGRLEKVYVTFPTAFWHGLPESKRASSGEAASTDSKHQNGNEASSTAAEHPPAFTLFQSPSYAEHPAGIPWNQECVSLADLPEGYAHPTLLFYIYGSCATHIMTQIKSLDPASDVYYEKLNGLLKPYFSRLAHYDEASSLCKPTAFLATQWQNDPWAGNGSYCNFQVGLENGVEDISTLRIGMGIERGVWLAGEHTAPFVGLGTTTGAYWSGELVAGKISRCYEMESKGGETVGDVEQPTGSSNKVGDTSTEDVTSGVEGMALNGGGPMCGSTDLSNSTADPSVSTDQP